MSIEQQDPSPAGRVAGTDEAPDTPAALPHGAAAAAAGESTPEPESRSARFLREVTSGSGMITVLAILVGLVAGAVLIVVTNSSVLAAMQYFAAAPGATFRAVGDTVGGAYAALFRGGIYDYTQTSFIAGLQPLTQSMSFAVPLIAAGLGIGIGFRAGVFNIGGQGQMLAGGAFAGWIAYALPMPAALHIPVAILGALVGGAICAGIAGLLKATTGAHEVIVTIMLNYVALYMVGYLLTTALKAPGSNNPISPAALPSAVLPGKTAGLNLGFVLAIALTLAAAWLMNRSALGFQFRAVGENPRAARVAGISVKKVVILTMIISGAFVGFAGAYEVLGQTTSGFTNVLDAGVGFNAITVALLGRNKPWGIFWAGILFGVFQAGGYAMQASQGVDIDVIQVVQSAIVLFIAAPPLVRAIFRLPEAGGRTKRTRSPKRTTKEAVAR
ncbi:MAG TPA: ABC transporter permease [Microbacteriaceae bacterium]|nr:ABC transporter permease [Microbacteriaceae bacterium]